MQETPIRRTDHITIIQSNVTLEINTTTIYSIHSWRLRERGAEREGVRKWGERELKWQRNEIDTPSLPPSEDMKSYNYICVTVNIDNY